MRYYRTPLETFQRAFTLIELMVTLSVLGVILAIALPNLRDFVVGNRLSANVNAFIGMLSYARSEAIIRNQRVIICAKRDGAIGCELADNDWGKYEMQIFVDVDGNDERDADDILLKTFAPIDASGTQFVFRKQTAPDVISFQSGGFTNIAHRFNTNVEDGDVAYQLKFGRTICISRPGRPRVIPYTNGACSA